MPGLRPLLPAALACLLAGAACTPSPSGDPAPGGRATAPDAASDPMAKAIADDPAIQEATPDELVELVVQAMSDDKRERALALVDLALSKDATHRDALLVKAGLLYGQAQELAATDRAAGIPRYREAAATMRTLRDAYPELRPQEQNLLIFLLFDEARALASQDQPEDAVDVLEEAVEAGLDVPAALDDEDLARLADREDFQALREMLRRRSTEKLKAEIARFEPFPIGFDLPTLDGKAATLEDLRGEAVTVVDIWGTWCPPCRREIPHFNDLYAKYKDAGVQIVGVTYENTPDIDEARGKVRAFLQELPISYPLVITDGSFIEQVPGFQGFPTTLFLDSQGQVRMVLVGEQPKEALELVITTLMEPPPASTPAPTESGPGVD